jgi:hypothetical protein
MSESPEFERDWQAKFARRLDEIAGKDIRAQVMLDERSIPVSDQLAVLDWTRQAMDHLDALVDERQRIAIMTGCACQYPKASLRAAREAYAAARHIDIPHQMLQSQFEMFLRDTLALDEHVVQEVVRRGWGLAGVREGNTIVATKIPKSGHLVEYLEEPNPQKRRQLYCHCPRVRALLETSETLSETYCYCGAGFYKSIWEEILQTSVEVELLESVLQGDEVCKIAIRLPSEQVDLRAKPEKP